MGQAGLDECVIDPFARIGGRRAIERDKPALGGDHHLLAPDVTAFDCRAQPLPDGALAALVARIDRRVNHVAALCQSEFYSGLIGGVGRVVRFAHDRAKAQARYGQTVAG